jgi:hypothetical protein
LEVPVGKGKSAYWDGKPAKKKKNNKGINRPGTLGKEKAKEGQRVKG